jgi:hypothetical protein
MGPVVLIWVLLGQAAPPDMQAERESLRDRLGISVAGGGGFGGGAVGVGGGLAFEGGVILRDRISIGARVSFVTAAVVFDGRVTLGVDYVLSDHFAIGAGVGLMTLFGILSMPASLSVVVPLRITFSPFTRAADKRARSGLVFGLEGAPGLAFAAGGYRQPLSIDNPVPPPPLVPGFALGGQLTIGWMWW